MKKVLLIGFPFPLRQGGSPRLLGLAKYLPEFGWQPVILSAPLDIQPEKQFTVIETGYKDALGFWGKVFKLNPKQDVRKQIKGRFGVKAKKSFLDSLMTLGGEIINYPDSDKGWKPYAIKTGEQLFAKEDFGAIISSSAPVTAHLIAHNLKSRYKVPWVADLRDLWTQNHNYYYSPLRKLIDKKLELKTLGAADALVTVSQPWAEKLGILHKGKNITAITNGFDPETVNIPPVPLTKMFTITYTGLIYPGNQDPVLLLAALQILITEGTIDPGDVEIRFYGSREDWLEKEAERYGLSGITRQYGEVPREVAIQKQRESQILLLLDWDDQQENGTIPGKIFEYMAAGRPIIATGGSADSVVTNLLNDTGTGIHASNIEAAAVALRQMYSEFKTHGKVLNHGNTTKIMKYSQREMANKFSNILENLLRPSSD